MTRLRCPECGRLLQVTAEDFPLNCCGRRYATLPEFVAAAKGAKPRPRKAIPTEGPGTELKAIFATLGVTESLGCGCEAMARQMNVWGPERCRLNRARIVKQISDTAAKKGWGETLAAGWASLTSGLALAINPLDRFGSLVDLAIDRADSKARAASED